VSCRQARWRQAFGCPRGACPDPLQAVPWRADARATASSSTHVVATSITRVSHDGHEGGCAIWKSLQSWTLGVVHARPEQCASLAQSSASVSLPRPKLLRPPARPCQEHASRPDSSQRLSPPPFAIEIDRTRRNQAADADGKSALTRGHPKRRTPESHSCTPLSASISDNRLWARATAAPSVVARSPIDLSLSLP